MELLKLVTDRSRVRMELLPSREEIAELYAKDDSIAFVDSILTGYEKKKVLMERFMEKGLPEQGVRGFLEYQILTDFVLTNTDRHLNNFGVLRDSRTLKFIRMAPIFDSGNSMFWDAPRLPERSDCTEITVNSFRNENATAIRTPWSWTQWCFSYFLCNFNVFTPCLAQSILDTKIGSA